MLYEQARGCRTHLERRRRRSSSSRSSPCSPYAIHTSSQIDFVLEGIVNDGDHPAAFVRPALTQVADEPAPASALARSDPALLSKTDPGRFSMRVGQRPRRQC